MTVVMQQKKNYYVSLSLTTAPTTVALAAKRIDSESDG